jgi:hypothetical protein
MSLFESETQELIDYLVCDKEALIQVYEMMFSNAPDAKNLKGVD